MGSKGPEIPRLGLLIGCKIVDLCLDFILSVSPDPHIDYHRLNFTITV
jgi:hypothetical protein